MSVAGFLPIVGVGFLVGFRHAFEPDHLAAVTTLATRPVRWNHGARLGVAWGMGHTASVGVVAGALIILGVHVPPGFYRSAEMAVALMLIVLGVSTLVAEARRHRASLGASHAKAHRGHVPHDHDPRIRTLARSTWFGVAHGLAGSGAVVVLLVASSSTRAGQLGYLLAFGVGTIAGMSLVSLLTGAVSTLAAARNLRVAQQIRVGAALGSAIVGSILGWSVYIG